MTWVWDEEQLGQLIEAIHASQEVVWDLETTGLISYAVEGSAHNGGVGARQVLATFTLPMADEHGFWDGVEPTTWILPLSHPDSPWRGSWRKTARRVTEAILTAGKSVTGHNVKFDVRYNHATAGVNLSERVVWDSQDASRIIEQGQSAKLADACHRAFGIPSWKDFDFSQPGVAETYPLLELGEYGARDTYWTWRLKRYQQERMFLLPEQIGHQPFGDTEIIEARMGRLCNLIVMPTVASLAQIEVNGIGLDVELTQSQLAESRRISTESLSTMAHRYEADWLADPETVKLNPVHASAAPTSHWFRDFMNLAVEKGDCQILAYTATGKPQWTKSVLGKLERIYGDESVPALVARQRKHTKRCEYLDSWLWHATTAGRVYAGYSTGMSTGRLSSSGPNMQQVTKELRPCFIPSVGKVIADFDFSQIELRVAAEISQCQPMLEAFHRGDDLHRLLAASVMGKAPEDVTATERQMAKAVNFGLLFGLGAYGLQAYAEDSYGVTMSRDASQEFYHGYFRTWKGLKEWHAAVEARLLRDGFSISPLGRVRYFRDNGREALNAAINAPVQGTASDLMQLAIADIQGLLHERGRGKVEGVSVVATVHDSAVLELPEIGWEDKALEVKERMENLNPLLSYLGVQFEVPITVEYTCGTRWSLSDVGSG